MTYMNPELKILRNKEVMLKMGKVDYYQNGRQLEVEEKHYYPIFLAKDAEGLREQPDTRKILRKYEHLEEPEYKPMPRKMSNTPSHSELRGSEQSKESLRSKISARERRADMKNIK